MKQILALSFSKGDDLPLNEWKTQTREQLKIDKYNQNMKTALKLHNLEYSIG